jgi:hypothetical protein
MRGSRLLQFERRLLQTELFQAKLAALTIEILCLNSGQGFKFFLTAVR